MTKGITITVSAETQQALAQMQQLFGAITSGLGRISGVSSQALAAFRSMPPAIAAVAVAATVATAGVGLLSREMLHGTQTAIEYADKLGKAAQRMGIVVQNLSGLSVAAKLADVSTEELGHSIAFLGKRVSEAEGGSEDARRLFRDLGIATRDASGELKSADQVLSEVADRFAAMPDGITKSRLAMELFERNGAQIIPLLNGGSEGLKQMRAEAERYGLVVGHDFAENAERFHDNLTRLKLIAQGHFLQLAEKLLPSLVKFSEITLKLTEDIASHHKVIDLVVTVYKVFASELTRMVFLFDALGTFFVDFSGNMAASGDPFASWDAALDRFHKKLDGLQQRLKEIAETGMSKAGEPKDKPVDEVERKRRLVAQMEDKLKELDLRIAEERLSAQNIQNNREIAPEEKQKRLNDQLATEIRLIQQKRQLTSDANSQKLITDREQREFELKNKTQLSDATADLTPESISGNVRRGLQDLRDEFGTVAKQISTTIKDVIGTAISSISSAITGLIEGTTTWGQALRQIGSSILGTVIDGLVRMFAAMVLGEENVAAAKLAKQAAVLPGALVEMLATAVGEGGWAAVALIGAAVAALAVGVAYAAGAFEEGGFTGSGGRSEVAGVVHRGEYVFSAPAVNRIGVGNLEAMHQGRAMTSRRQRGGGEGANIQIRVVEAKSSWESWKKSDDAENWVLDVVSRNLHKVQ